MPDYRQILWDGRRWLGTAVLLFVVGILLGYIAAAAEPEMVTERIRPLLGLLQSMGDRLAETSSPVERTSIIFRNNGLAVLRMMVMGILPFPVFGFWPAVGSFGNGAILGIILGLGTRLTPMAASPGLFLLATVPHGIIELPAVWIGAAWGMKFGLAWLMPGAAGQRLKVLWQNAVESAQMFVLASVLLIVAAAIEANITLSLVQSARNTLGIL
ncbi:MAG TPA: stage II sporulation protein M [Chloroflexota bacterium]|nr:stage II sporulation protein M [Chloroflexota bacterium]